VIGTANPAAPTNSFPQSPVPWYDTGVPEGQVDAAAGWLSFQVAQKAAQRGSAHTIAAHENS